MKRTLGAAIAALAALCLLLGPTRPAASAPVPTSIPNFVRPGLFEGFEPIRPDELGISPDGDYFVFQDDEGFHVVRLFDGVETFSLSSVQDNLTVGFDPSDERLFLIEPRRGGEFRFYLVDPFTGALLRSDRLSYWPTIRTNIDGSVIVLLEPVQRQSRVRVLDEDGLIVFRRSYSSQLGFAVHPFFPTVVFFDPEAGGNVGVEVLNAVRGTLTFRESLSALGSFGFAPFGPTFVTARPLSVNTFRVRLVDALTGRLLVSRSFSGSVNAGFTPDGSLLGVVVRRGLNQEVNLFRTFDGREIFVR